MTVSNTPVPTEEERDLVRQGERTVDNLKRLFAVVFALSFAAVANGAIDKLRPLLVGSQTTLPDLRIWLLNGEMVAVFVVTAGVFYHQSTKFLDIRYAKHPLSRAHPLGFALDYITLVLTVAPFFLMAHAFAPSVTKEVGYLWFFGSYVVLLSFGLGLLLISEIRHSRFVREKILKEVFAAEEIARESTLRLYWLVMNSFVLLIIVGLFDLATLVDPCPVSSSHGRFPYFLFAFGALALARDYFDFRYAWRFLYPVPAAAAAKFDKWPITSMGNIANQKAWNWVGHGFIALIIAILVHLRVWDVTTWVSSCS
jgi:hypothetical protein